MCEKLIPFGSSCLKIMNNEFAQIGKYSLLKDFSLELDGEDETFDVCFWVYLKSSDTFPATILDQVYSDGTDAVPFIILNEKQQLVVLLLHNLTNKAPDLSTPSSWTEVPHVVMESEFPQEEWVHFGLQISTTFTRMFINGNSVGEKFSSVEDEHKSTSVGKIFLVGRKDGKTVEGYVHNAEVLPPKMRSIKRHYHKDPPIRLSIDNSSTSEIEVGDDGVWSIVGGKASCRRNFSLDVILTDFSGQPVLKEMEVVASLIFAHNEKPVEKTSDKEPPLFATYDGIEFPSRDRPSKLLHGRSSFKLKISQLSSKCDNRLFCIRFHAPEDGSYSFHEVVSPPIRCISRSRNTRVTPLWKNLATPIKPVENLTTSSDSVDISPLQKKLRTSSELVKSPLLKKLTSPSNLADKSPVQKKFRAPTKLVDKSPLKRKLTTLTNPVEMPEIYRKGMQRKNTSPPSMMPDRLEQVRISATSSDSPSVERPDEECSSHIINCNQVENVSEPSLEGGTEDSEEVEDSPSVSGSNERRTLDFKSTSNRLNLISDASVFKYCLADVAERSLMLREIATTVSDEDVFEFAAQISLYSGCLHHRGQILMAKGLIEEGTQVWNSLSQNNDHVLWDSLVFHIQEQFMRISQCSSRSLTQQDFETLRTIAGCQKYIAIDNFERMWCWLYPVAFALSGEWMNSMWSSTSPKWIEGFITKEDAESSLRGPRGPQEPGTFILRFPTSRSWPHPDAGNLVVTYVGTDYSLHHRLLSFDYMYSSAQTEKIVNPLQDMLLAEPELSRLGRIVRSH